MTQPNIVDLQKQVARLELNLETAHKRCNTVERQRDEEKDLRGRVEGGLMARVRERDRLKTEVDEVYGRLQSAHGERDEALKDLSDARAYAEHVDHLHNGVVADLALSADALNAALGRECGDCCNNLGSGDAVCFTCAETMSRERDEVGFQLDAAKKNEAEARSQVAALHRELSHITKELSFEDGMGGNMWCSYDEAARKVLDDTAAVARGHDATVWDSVVKWIFACVNIEQRRHAFGTVIRDANPHRDKLTAELEVKLSPVMVDCEVCGAPGVSAWVGVCQKHLDEFEEWKAANEDGE